MASNRHLGRIAHVLNPRRPPQGPTIGVHSHGVLDLSLTEALADWTPSAVVQVADPRDVNEQDLCEWTGASSGRSRGDIVGSLRTISVDGVPLRHCWYVASPAREGDSGAAVFDLSASAVLGQVVACTGIRLSDGKRIGAVVQDASILRSAAAELIPSRGLNIEVRLANRT